MTLPRTLHFVVILLLGLPLFAQESSVMYSAEIREKLYPCGYNSLYLFLRLQGYHVSFDNVKEKVHVGVNGTSFLDMQNGAAKFGVSVRVSAKKHELTLRVFHSQSPDVLHHISLPYLIHHSNENNKNDDAFWNGNSLLVIGRGRKHFMVIECGTIQIAEVSDKIIRRHWSGYLLAKKPIPKANFFSFANVLFKRYRYCIFFGLLRNMAL